MGVMGRVEEAANEMAGPAAAGGGSAGGGGAAGGGGGSAGFHCARSLFQVPLTNDHASAGRVTWRVVRNCTPVPRPRDMPSWASVADEASGNSSRLRLNQGPTTIA